MIYVNKKQVEISKFPNGESLIKVEDIQLKEINEIILKFKNDEDITHLIFIKNYLDEKGLKSILILPYIPYSRMDRTEGFTVFTLKYFCKTINNLNFEFIEVYEPHSDVSVALLDKVKVINMSAKISEKLIKENNSKNLYLVFPDAGAEKRYSKQIKYNKILTASKERDFKTGYIKKLDINGSVEGDKFDAIIVDDLCSKGGTFMLTAKKLKEMGAEDINLVVTHCENTIFEGDVLNTNLINKIYTTDSILTKEHEKIIINKII